MQCHCYATVCVALSVLRLSDAVAYNSTHLDSPCDGKEKASTLLDVANDFIKKAKNLYPDCIDNDLQCGRKEKSLAFLEVASNLITGVKKNFPTCPEPECPTVSEPVCPTVPEPECPKVCDEKPMDCSEILDSGKTTSGIYTIWPRSHTMPDKEVSVYCDMDTDGGGWTVIQRRGQFSTPKDFFYKDWNSYKIGFGSLKEEFWLGNDNIHVISNQANCTIRFDLKDADGDTAYAQYNTFWIGDELSQYTLRISGYNGNAGVDYMFAHNQMRFSTKDQKHDKTTSWPSCSEIHKGAWWYNVCGLISPNGLNQPGVDSRDGMFWFSFRKYVGLSGVEMKLRPRNYSNKN